MRIISPDPALARIIAARLVTLSYGELQKMAESLQKAERACIEHLDYVEVLESSESRTNVSNAMSKLRRSTTLVEARPASLRASATVTSAMPSSKKKIIESIVEECDLTEQKASAVIEAMLEHIKSALKKGEEVRIPNFGVFRVAKRKARDGVNPLTGASIRLPASNMPAFKPAKTLKSS